MAWTGPGPHRPRVLRTAGRRVPKQVRLELGNLGRFCADHRICRFDFGARAPRPLGLSTTYDAAFTRAGRDPPPSSRPMTSPIQVASSTTTPRNHRSARRSRPTYDVSAGHTPRPVGGFAREFSSGPSTALDDLAEGRRAGLEVTRRAMGCGAGRPHRRSGRRAYEAHGENARRSTPRAGRTRGAARAPRRWAARVSALGYAHYTRITGIRPPVGGRDSRELIITHNAASSPPSPPASARQLSLFTGFGFASWKSVGRAPTRRRLIFSARRAPFSSRSGRAQKVCTCPGRA